MEKDGLIRFVREVEKRKLVLGRLRIMIKKKSF